MWLKACLVRRRCLAREDVRQRFDVHVLEHALAARALEARYELGPKDVDLPVEDPAPVRHLLLLAGQVVDQLLQLVVRQASEIRQRLHGVLSFGVKLRLRFYLSTVDSSVCITSSTRDRSSASSCWDSSSVRPSA